MTLSALNLMALLQIGHSWELCMAVWTAGALPFFFSNWEEFYTGTLCPTAVILSMSTRTYER